MLKDTIPGSTAIPDEAWNQFNFRLTDRLERAELAIQAARNTSGHWASEHLLTPQHPILQWLAERLVMQLKRGDAPYLTSPRLRPRELCYCFIGQVSAKVGVPLLVDAHAVSFMPGGTMQVRPLAEAVHAAHLHALVNTGQTFTAAAAQPLVRSAVAASLAHLLELKDRRELQLRPILTAEARRLRQWVHRRREVMEKSIARYESGAPQIAAAERRIAEAEDWVRDHHQQWLDARFTAARDPVTRLVLVIEGVA